MTATRERVLLVGLPRSGTTVVANYLHSLANGFCFLEPHWEVGFYGSTRAFRDPKLRWMFRLRYSPDSPLPMDDAVGRVLRRYDVVGIKETYRGRHYARHESALPNEALLSRYLDAGYRLLPIWREPLAVWNSFRAFPQHKTWAGDLDAFIENYPRFADFAAGTPPIIYERFAGNPLHEMQRVGLGPGVANGGIQPRYSRMGDPNAGNSSTIGPPSASVNYTPDQRLAIELSSLNALYTAVRDQL